MRNRALYQKAQSEILEKFKKDLFEEFNVAFHPKAEKAYSMAWERGHSQGLQSVCDEFEELVELLN